MGAAVVLLAIILGSLICIRAGAIALELTGLEREKARFQALSAFTNTGFTTREAEEITHYPVRRRIITVLIILGYAGTVSVIATFATSLLQKHLLQTALRFSGILIALVAFYLIARWVGLLRRAGGLLRHWLVNRYGLRAPTLENMLGVSAGFGVVRVVVAEGSNMAGRPLSDLGLKMRKVQILSIARKEETITIPQGHDILQPGDAVICYGDLGAVVDMFAARADDRPWGPAHIVDGADPS